MRQYILEYSRGLLHRVWVFLEGEVTIGRGPENAIPLHDPAVSRSHARIVQRDGNWVIEDLESQNGTFANGQRIKERCLAPDDVIRIGGVQLRFKAADEIASPAALLGTTQAGAPHGRAGVEEPIFTSPPEIKGQMELVRTFLDALPFGIAVINRRMEVLHANRTCGQDQGAHDPKHEHSLGCLLGCHKAGRDGRLVCPGDHCEGCPVLVASQKAFQDGMPTRDQETDWSGLREGVPTHLRFSLAPLPYTLTGEPLGLFTWEDISERKRAEERLRYLSAHDAMTGLYNRAYFEEEMARLERGRRFPVSILVADVDGLKAVNDSQGHEAGDELLKRAASAIRAACRAEDVTARIGGDEFAVILPGADLEIAVEAIARVRNAVAATADPRLRLSLGAATATRGESLTELLRLADEAMYRDKGRE